MYSQRNIEKLFELIGGLSNQAFVRTENYDFVWTKDNSWPNQLLNLRATESTIDGVLDSIELQHVKALLPNLLMCNPGKDDPLVFAKIKARNYQSSKWTAMSHSLILEDLPSGNDDVSIKSVDNTRELRSWLQIVEIELMGGHQLNPDIFTALLCRDDCHFFLGMENDKPVATSFLFTESRCAGIYLVSSLKAHRKKGIGTQMTATCLEKAKALNCQSVELQATDSGKRVYESLGFENHGTIHVVRIQNR